MIDLKKELNERFYNSLEKCNFLNDVNELVNNEGLVNIDLSDFIKLSDGEITGTISETIDNVNDKLNINTISDKIPNNCIINISYNTNLKLTDVDTIIHKIKNKYPDISIIFGASITSENKYKIQALFVYKI